MESYSGGETRTFKRLLKFQDANVFSNVMENNHIIIDSKSISFYDGMFRDYWSDETIKNARNGYMIIREKTKLCRLRWRIRIKGDQTLYDFCKRDLSYLKHAENSTIKSNSLLFEDIETFIDKRFYAHDLTIVNVANKSVKKSRKFYDISKYSIESNGDNNNTTVSILAGNPYDFVNKPDHFKTLLNFNISDLFHDSTADFTHIEHSTHKTPLERVTYSQLKQFYSYKNIGICVKECTDNLNAKKYEIQIVDTDNVSRYHYVNSIDNDTNLVVDFFHETVDNVTKLVVRLSSTEAYYMTSVLTHINKFNPNTDNQIQPITDKKYAMYKNDAPGHAIVKHGYFFYNDVSNKLEYKRFYNVPFGSESNFYCKRQRPFMNYNVFRINCQDIDITDITLILPEYRSIFKSWQNKFDYIISNDVRNEPSIESLRYLMKELLKTIDFERDIVDTGGIFDSIIVNILNGTSLQGPINVLKKINNSRVLVQLDKLCSTNVNDTNDTPNSSLENHTYIYNYETIKLPLEHLNNKNMDKRINEYLRLQEGAIVNFHAQFGERKLHSILLNQSISVDILDYKKIAGAGNYHEDNLSTPNPPNDGVKDFGNMNLLSYLYLITRPPLQKKTVEFDVIKDYLFNLFGNFNISRTTFYPLLLKTEGDIHNEFLYHIKDSNLLNIRNIDKDYVSGNAKLPGSFEKPHMSPYFKHRQFKSKAVISLSSTVSSKRYEPIVTVNSGNPDSLSLPSSSSSSLSSLDYILYSNSIDFFAQVIAVLGDSPDKYSTVKERITTNLQENLSNPDTSRELRDLLAQIFKAFEGASFSDQPSNIWGEESEYIYIQRYPDEDSNVEIPILRNALPDLIARSKKFCNDISNGEIIMVDKKVMRKLLFALFTIKHACYQHIDEENLEYVSIDSSDTLQTHGSTNAKAKRTNRVGNGDTTTSQHTYKYYLNRTLYPFVKFFTCISNPTERCVSNTSKYIGGSTTSIPVVIIFTIFAVISLWYIIKSLNLI